jgi:SAM-dependent methyltransferase
MKRDLYAPPGRELVRQTRPGTPMIGPYSVNQMDDFYRALSVGVVKPTGVMNYVQRLYIAECCTSGADVIDVCCGRGLQLPVLYRYAPHIASYTGLDITPAHLGEARDQVSSLDRLHGSRPFTITFAECDVSRTWPPVPAATVIIYTSALEHLPRASGVASLKQAATALAQDGVLYLSTPNTQGDPPRLLQHGVHVYEWNDAELRPVLADAGLVIEDTVGLLPPSGEVTVSVLAERYGEGAVAWYRRLTETVPAPFLDVVSAAALGGAALELLYICRRRK